LRAGINVNFNSADINLDVDDKRDKYELIN